MLLSIITPCYNEEEALPYFLKAIRMESEKLLMELGLEIEIIFVDDGSRDRTMELLRAAAKEDRRVRYISFSRNFGKESAMYAGMEAALGECAVIMDADLQHPPVMLEEMYRAITEEGYDIAAARRVSRKGEPPVRSLFARLFYKLINKISKAEFVDGASDFRMLSRPAVDALLRLGEYNRFSKGIFGWIGFKTKWIPYENVERVAGETTWSFWKLLLYSLDGIPTFPIMWTLPTSWKKAILRYSTPRSARAASSPAIQTARSYAALGIMRICFSPLDIFIPRTCAVQRITTGRSI